MRCQYGKLCNCNDCEYGFLIEDYYYDCELRLEEEATEQEYMEHLWMLEQEQIEEYEDE